MRRNRLRFASVLLVWLGILISPLSRSGASTPSASLPPNPYDILASGDLEAPTLDAVPFCQPQALESAAEPILDRARAQQWAEARELLQGWMDQRAVPSASLRTLEAVLVARAAEERTDRVEAMAMLRARLRDPELGGENYCLRAELARLLLLQGRESESAAQWTLAERKAVEGGFADRVSDAIAMGRAEILYRTGRRFDAHLGFRAVAKSKNPRLAAAARLRLTDLSFDAGNVDRVSAEYETLLPRVSLFGGAPGGWALRAAEAALDAGRRERGRRWIDRYLASGPPRDGRDAAEIRLADLDVLDGDPLAARKRLKSVSSRRNDDEVGALAAVRAIQLGLFEGSPPQRIAILKRVVRTQRRGVRAYALDVLMSELEEQGDLEGALVVATRLAYAGIDPVVSADFEGRLGRLLEGVTAGGASMDCDSIVRTLGGRYGILIERTEKILPWKRVGLCFEQLELPWLAAEVYRSMTRRFGTRGASAVALPLARSSLATGEVMLARRMALAALGETGPDEARWRAVLAEAEFREGRLASAARELRAVLETQTPGFEQGKWVRLFAMALRELALERKMNASDLHFLSESIPNWLASPDHGPAARAQLIESALLAAHAQRSLGRLGPAAKLYSTVVQQAAPGALNSSAQFWLARLTESEAAADSETDARPAGDDNPPLSSPWSRLAQFEASFAPLREAYGGSAP